MARPQLSCGARCGKLLLLVFNAVFWSSGIILFAIGLFFLVEDDRSLLFKLFADESTSYALLQYLAWAFVALGVAIFVVGFCGCCGVIKESRWVILLVSDALLFRLLFRSLNCNNPNLPQLVILLFLSLSSPLESTFSRTSHHSSSILLCPFSPFSFLLSPQTQYFIFLLLIFTTELTVGILAVVFQEKVVADLKLELTGKLKKEYGLASALTAAVDLAQTRVRGQGSSEKFRKLCPNVQTYKSLKLKRADNFHPLFSLSLCYSFAFVLL